MMNIRNPEENEHEANEQEESKLKIAMKKLGEPYIGNPALKERNEVNRSPAASEYFDTISSTGINKAIEFIKSGVLWKQPSNDGDMPRTWYTFAKLMKIYYDNIGILRNFDRYIFEMKEDYKKYNLNKKEPSKYISQLHITLDEIAKLISQLRISEDEKARLISQLR